MATVHAAPNFDAHKDAETLYNAMKGLGTDEDAIIDVLSHRSLEQRQVIEKTFKAVYGMDLKNTLHKELSGYFRLAVLYSFYDKAHVNASALYRAMKGLGTDETILIDVICSSSNEEIHELKEAYNDILREKRQNLSRRSLEQDVIHDVSGDFERVLVALLQGKRRSKFTKDDVVKDCESLYQAGEAKFGTDEAIFTKVFVNCPWEEIIGIATLYLEAVGNDLFTTVEKETSGDYRDALLALLKTALNRKRYYAEVLYQSMKGVGTHDENLVRMIMAHCNTDLAEIKQEFLEMYDTSLEDMVKGDTSGDQRKFLLAMMGVHEDK
ncbi:Annexin A13 [Echinococcus granulosus]|uniref:Annexin n=1 Tax=Echinococcus granulosus TaxID=6210 RepID=A0A068WJF9_ECHGR|nr:Annexin A13 [Echinococcus granulosus]CDS20230.1 annexin [Echinococcus granulosus]